MEVQILTGEAWLQRKKGNKTAAEQLMTQAADMEDATMKHPVTPGEVLPARELLADMYMEMGKTGKALAAYEADISMHPGRLNGMRGKQIAMK